MAKRIRRVKGEGSIYQRTDGRWAAKYNGKIRYARNSLEARDKLQELKAETEDAAAQANVYTITELTAKYLAMKSTSLKGTSLDRLEQTITSQVVPRNGSLDAATITSDMVKTRVLDAMYAEGLAYSSIKKAYDALNGCYKYAVSEGFVRMNPLNGYNTVHKE